MSFVSNLGKIVNESKYKEPANEFVVVTKKDNLVHNYFFYCDTFWDAGNCYNNIILGFAKDKHDKINYWTDQKDELVYVYMGNDVTKQYVKNDKFYDIKDHQKPFFVGRVSDVTEASNQMEVKLSNIGERFKAKIPDDFRQKYINGQNVRDAFQAICEFLGVYYICPPKTEQQTGAVPEDGSINDPDSKTTQESGLANQIAKNSEDKNNTQTENNNTNNSQSNTDTNADETAKSAIQQGYSQISFDSNGAITFNNNTIEESFDSEEALLSITDTTYDSFLEEGKEVLDDIKKFLNGEVFEELHPFYLDYNSITIEPSSTSSSTPQSISGAADGSMQVSPDTKSITKTTPTTVTPNTNLGNLANITRAGQQSRLTSVKSPTNLNTVVHPMTIGVRK